MVCRLLLGHEPMAIGLDGGATNRTGVFAVRNRFVAANAALVIAVGIAGCSSPAAPPQPGALPPGTAQVTVNGKDMGRTDAVSCSQVEWAFTIHTGDTTAGATAVVQGGGGLSAKSVEIRNLDGFTGTYWDDHGGNADASIAGDTWTITGTVSGFTTVNPKPATATFQVKANC
jgi:hypothetical protein